ncbi:alpha/beta hydrolase family protein [Brevundimonas sp.]|jgi:pimeloyl-ACP methyl ester carboxylesterase|uniref:alpha/beta hydrolase family protein n=1 Tax=Brevundimonas sp. TaxID=1871086 RepID=UPI0037BE76A5
MKIGHMGRGTAIATTLLFTLAGCMSVNVPEDAFFYPDTRVAAERITLPADIPMDFETQVLTVPYPGGNVGATRVRTGRADAPLILFCGGNLFRRGAQAGKTAAKLAPFGDVLMFDYPGYGDTAGQADYAAFMAAGAVMARTARAQADAEGRKLIAWGHSLGGPVCAQAAQLVHADALVLETTTPTTRAAVDTMVGWARPFVRIHIAPNLNSIDIPAALQAYSGKVVVLEAGLDDTLPASLSRKLVLDLKAEGVDVDHLAFPGAGHNDVGRQPDFQSRVAAALQP